MAITFPFSIPKFENPIKQGCLTPWPYNEATDNGGIESGIQSLDNGRL